MNCAKHKSDIQERLMDADIIGELGMKRTCKDAALTGCYYVAIKNRQHLYPIAATLDVWCTDEYHGHLTNAFHLMLGTETAKLSAVGVAPDGDIHTLQMSVVKKYHSGTGS